MDYILPILLLFIGLATSMFGLGELRLPASLQSSMSRVGGKGPLGAFLMGLVGGIVIAPCTGPVLAGVLTYVATTRNAVMGAGLLFTYAIGIGVLFWLIATFAVALPKSGAWMDGVKSVFGIGLLVAALYYLQNASVTLARFSSGHYLFALLCALAIGAGVLLGGVHLTFGGGALRNARKVLGIVLITVGAFGLVNFVLTPRTKLEWVYDEAAAISLSKKEGRPILVDFWARYCTPCKLMEAAVFTDSAVRRELERFVLFKVDVSEDTQRDQALRAKYRAPNELPILIVLDSSGLEKARAGKLETAAAMLRLLRQAR